MNTNQIDPLITVGMDHVGMLMTSSTMIELINKHLEIWTETDSVKRLALAREIYANDIRVTDPGVILNGIVQVSDFIGKLLAEHPGFKFKMAGQIEAHHNTAILFWQFGPESKPETITGQDIFTIENGKIISLLVFITGVTQ